MMCAGRVVVITGAGTGLGREYAIALARAGARVVVNDLGVGLGGEVGNSDRADAVVAEIRDAGGDAVANIADVADFRAAQGLVEHALRTFGRLDVIVNNAGIFRPAPLVEMSEEQWDSVVAVHLRGTFALTRWAAAHWSEQSARGEAVDARVINTTSVSGLYGIPGQLNYGAAKAAVAAFTIGAALELATYGATVNAIAPIAFTRMTEQLPSMQSAEYRDLRSTRWVSPLVTWLSSPASAAITGRVIEATGSYLAIAEGWQRGPVAEAVSDPSDIGRVVLDLHARARRNSGMDGSPGTPPQPQTAGKPLNEADP